MGSSRTGSGRFTDRSVSNSLARVHGFAQRKVHAMSALLESYAAGGWFRADDEGQPLLDAATGEEVARISATGLDLGAMTDHARSVGGPAIRALTFHERAGLLKALAKHLTEVKDELYALSYRTGATKRDSMVDIDGGIGTVFSYRQQGHPRAAQRHRRTSTARSSGSAAAAPSSASTSTPRGPASRCRSTRSTSRSGGCSRSSRPAFLAGLPTHREAGQPDGVPHRARRTPDHRVRPPARGLAAAAVRQPGRPARRAPARRTRSRSPARRTPPARLRQHPSTCSTAASSSASRPTR